MCSCVRKGGGVRPAAHGSMGAPVSVVPAFVQDREHERLTSKVMRTLQLLIPPSSQYLSRYAPSENFPMHSSTHSRSTHHPLTHPPHTQALTAVVQPTAPGAAAHLDVLAGRDPPAARQQTGTGTA